MTVGSAGASRTGDPALPLHRRDGLLCALFFAGCVLVAYPVGPFGFIDDFSYARTALDFARTGHFLYNGWATAMLGWLIPWGAAFIKLFGFSFDVLRLAMLPIAMASVYLFHQALIRFGIGRRNAVLGALTLALTPNFFPLATSFMTDLPGLFGILVCLVMCQRALGAHTARSTCAWLGAAALLNLGLGTVRQTTWLGALVMVPAAGWLLRKRAGVLLTALCAAGVSLLGVLYLLHWANRQPGFVLDSTLTSIHLDADQVKRLGGNLFRALLLLLFLLLPLTAAWLPSARRLSRRAFLASAMALLLLGAGIHMLRHRDLLDSWLMPWVVENMVMERHEYIDQLRGSSVLLSLVVRVALTWLIAIATVAMGAQLPQLAVRGQLLVDNSTVPARRALWLLTPFSLAYLLLLVPRAATALIFDRYLLCLLPSAIVLLLLLYQGRAAQVQPRWGQFPAKHAAPALPILSFVILALLAFYSIGNTHDLYADQRAQEIAVQRLLAAGIARPSISQSLNADGWQQLAIEGRVLSFAPEQPLPVMKGPCHPFIAPYTPALDMQYFIVSFPSSCLIPTGDPPTAYRAWLPPFHRHIFIERLPPPTSSGSHESPADK